MGMSLRLVAPALALLFLLPRSLATAENAPSCGDGERSQMEKLHPKDLAPEPVQPAVECSFSRNLRCVPPSPTRSAWQMAPFSQCPRTIDRWSSDLFHAKPAFSRKETRAHRLAIAKKGCTATTPLGPCCYVQFSTEACD